MESVVEQVNDCPPKETNKENISYRNVQKINLFHIPKTIKDNKSDKIFVESHVVGRGANSKCVLYKELGNTDNQYVFKIIPKSSGNQLTSKRVAQEVRLNKTIAMNHPFFVRFHAYSEDEKNHYMIFDYCSGGNMLSLVEKKMLNPDLIKKYVLDILLGLDYLHNRLLVIHRDIKLANLFLTADNQVKIGDFGLSTLLLSKDEKKWTVAGTPNYISPEIVKGQLYSFPVDIWSFGVCLYIMITSKPPFEGSNVEDTHKNIKELKYKPLDTENEFKIMIEEIFNLDSTRRPTAKDLLDKVQGPATSMEIV